MPTHVWFIRHGEVEAPFVGTFLGTSDVALSDVGKHQAEAVAEFLKQSPIDVVVTSPRLRARQTAQPLCEALGKAPVVVDGLAEMHFGEWEGLTWPAIERRDPEFAATWQADPGNIACPGGDDANTFAARAKGALRDVVKDHPDQTVALFSHAGTNRAILSEVTGMPYLDTFCFAQDYGCVNAALFDAAAAQIALLNVVPGPDSDNNGDGGRRIEE